MFKIKANPTFQAKVDIPVAGGNSVSVGFTFKHRTKKELGDWLDSIAQRREDRKGENLDTEIVMEVVEGWVNDEAEAKALKVEPFYEKFSRENVELLVEERIGAALAIRDTYINELTKQREKN